MTTQSYTDREDVDTNSLNEDMACAAAEARIHGLYSVAEALVRADEHIRNLEHIVISSRENGK